MSDKQLSEDQIVDSQTTLSEHQCVEAFLNWHNKRNDTCFSYERAENIFTEIAYAVRWEFVITQNGYSSWHGIEIKRLIKPEASIKLIRWNKFLARVKKSLPEQLQGEYFVYGVPPLNLDKERRSVLKRLLIELITKSATSFLRLSRNLSYSTLLSSKRTT